MRTKPQGLKLDREGLKVHASGKISQVFGPLFEQQDGYEVQVRMPEPPLLLADRLVGLEAEAGSMKRGRLWTETDVRADAWYMHDGRMPAGLMIESGQADLMLISYLGVDFILKGERRYRLLGCELTWHDGLPKPGEVLQYEIHVDGHAKQGDVRLFFFHYDCYAGDRLKLSVRGGQAGFFTREELNESMGVLWSAEEGERCAEPRLSAPRVALTGVGRYGRRELEAFAAGRVWECFGAGFETAAAHTRTPRIAGGRMLFLEEVTHLEHRGGPWGRGYLRAVDRISPDDWFFEGHFKNDPCMPGTLMFEGCLQAMAFYLTSLGYTLDRDGGRFEPVTQEKYKMICRGEVGRGSKELIYEVFVEEVIDGPEPVVYADLLCTVDGLKAFHCRRMGLRLVPDWPLENRPRAIAAMREASAQRAEASPSAARGGFVFDEASLLACAWGRPTRAFGPLYEVFDSARKVARLPGPPYHFMTRIVGLDADPGSMKVGATVEVEYDIPKEAWYFAENGCASMPFCVLLEAALQPCGWLASYLGSATLAPRDMSFRNLDGTGVTKAEVWPWSGTLKTRARIVDISKSAGMLIESFEVECFLGERPVYGMKTVFGFFPPEALAAQKGLPTEAAHLEALEAPCGEVEDLALEPPRYVAGSARLAEPFLRLIDRVTGIWPTGGSKGLGRYRAEKDVRPDAWYFRAHFFQDPVQPGSLGVEAMVQLLQFAMLHKHMADGVEAARFEPIGLDAALKWKYRGQVLQHNRKVVVTLDLTAQGRDERGPWVLADASLWVDGMRIYEASGLGMRVVSGLLPRPGEVEVLDVERAPWLGDHRPTWTVPAVPMMSLVERLARAGWREDSAVVGLRDVRVRRWVTLPTALRARKAGVGDVLGVELSDDQGVVASGSVVLGREYVAGPAPWASVQGQEVASPYETGGLFHGPAFQLMTRLVMGARGASAWMDAGKGEAPRGLLHQILLDAATHAIPHDELWRWCAEVPGDQVAYPAWIPAMQFHDHAPLRGEVRCEVRWAGFAGGPRFPKFAIQWITGDKVWATAELVEALFPKGAIGCAPPLERRAFLRDRRYVEGVGLSSVEDGATWLQAADVDGSDWLPGTVEALYGTRDPEEVARREHLARAVKVHPGALPGALPLTAWPLEARWEGAAVEVRAAGPERLALAPVRKFWASWFGKERWPVEDLYYGLIERFVRRVVLPDPEALEAVRGRSCLYVANHQVGVESLLFSILASGLLEVPTVTLAKAEHRDSWLGRLIKRCFSYPGVEDPQVIAFFDRADRGSMQEVLADLAARMQGPGRSVMIHVEGTRAVSARKPVEKMSGAFLDMALALEVPVVPVRFVGGLPLEPLDARLEFPVGMGSQDYWIGKPLLPEELRPLPYGERKRRVLEAMNALGPPVDQEEPNPPSPWFEAEVAQWRAQHPSATPEHATLGAVLSHCADPCEETLALLDGTDEGLPAEVLAWIRGLRALILPDASLNLPPAV